MGAPVTPTDPFGTVAQMSSYLRVEIDPDDVVANLGLEAATEVIQSATDQVIARVEDDVIRRDGTGIDKLLLPELPVISVDRVVVDIDTDSPTELLGPEHGGQAEWDVDLDKGLLIRRKGRFITWGDQFSATFGNWPARPQAIEVTYTHGYDPVPKSIQLLCAVIASRAFAQDGVTQETVGTYVAMYAGQPGTMTSAEKDILARYHPGRRS